MKTTAKIAWVLLAAVSAVEGFGPSSALAQYRVGTDGRALDANNRIGSGGFNDDYLSDTVYNAGLAGNRLITGNVTGGRGFRGNVPYTDPREFRGGVAGSDFDRFIARSSGAGQAYTSASPNAAPEIFYGRSLATAPPAGFTQQGYTGTYRATPAAADGLIDSRLDTRIMLPRPGDLMLPGPVDPSTNQPTVITASPLLGVRQLRPGDSADRDFILNYTSMRPDNVFSRLRVDPATLGAMRDQLAASIGRSGTGETDPATGKPKEDKPANLISGELPVPFDAPVNQALVNQTLGGQPLDGTITGRLMTNEVKADGSTFRRLIAPAASQSSQYAELQSRLNRYYSDRLQTDQQKNAEILKQLKAREAAADNKNPAAATQQPQIPLPDYSKISKEMFKPADNAQKPLEPQDLIRIPQKPKPIKITSLAMGIKAEGLANALKKAEALMVEGKFSGALDQYELAGAVAPNNSMVWLGKAHAELGAGYFNKSEQHLRAALTADPVLTMAQFDLRGMVGADRLDAVVKDLKEIARTNEKDPGAPLLLAYIAYNTGNEKQAGIYLELAQKRGNPRDDFYRLLWSHWTLPEDVPAVPSDGK